MQKNRYETPSVTIKLFDGGQDVLDVSAWVDESLGEQGIPDIWA